MRTALGYLARNRWAGVGLALLAELALLVALSLASPAATIGIPAALAAAIAGTVAVVFGVVDGVAVAAAGAIAFAALGGWGAGELAAIGVWPAIVAAVGLFARRVEHHRLALRHLVDAQEDERRALALALHDDSAQMLAGALMTLRSGAAGAAADGQTLQARDLITDTIRQLRRLALELSPKALEDYGLAAAVGHLVESDAYPDDIPVAFERDWDGRMAREAESALFRFAQAALAAAHAARASAIRISLAESRGRVRLTVVFRGAGPQTSAAIPATVEERVRLLGGKVTTTPSDSGELRLSADMPTELRVVERDDIVA
jgi:signal transduction histidine kinase